MRSSLFRASPRTVGALGARGAHRTAGPTGVRAADSMVCRGVASAACLALCLAASLATLAGCDTQRKQDCDKFLSAMTPIGGSAAGPAAPAADAIDGVHDAVAGMQFVDVPLREYATNYKNTLTVLSSTLKLKAAAGPDGPPNGTEDVIKQNVKDARTDYDDVTRYCSQ
jgi:hypothetical protein